MPSAPCLKGFPNVAFETAHLEEKESWIQLSSTWSLQLVRGETATRPFHRPHFSVAIRNLSDQHQLSPLVVRHAVVAPPYALIVEVYLACTT